MTTQELEQLEDSMFFKTTIHFEGRDLQFELPVNLSDEKLHALVLSELVAASSTSSAEDEYLIFGVSAAGSSSSTVTLPSLGDTSSTSSLRPLGPPDIREAIQRDGMLLGVRRSQHASSLLEGAGIKQTVDVTPSCSILLNGGVDYDLPTALAELVDNAIAALEPNGSPVCTKKNTRQR